MTEFMAGPALARRVDVEVRGALDRRTRRLAFLSVTAAVGERLIARAQITKSVVSLA